jgi:peptidyl-dipeptidase A
VPAATSADRRAEAFLREVTELLAPLEREANLRDWEVAVRGTPEAVEAAVAAERAVARALADPERYRTARALLDDPAGSDPVLRRALTLFVLRATEMQLPEPVLDELVARAKAIEATFSTFRPEWEGRRASPNDLLAALRTERDVERRRTAWEASKTVAAAVADPLRELAALRNDAARRLGFRDYYALRLHLQEIDERELFGFLDRVERATDAPYATVKARIDEALAARYGIAAGELRPWHYEDPFVQEAPQVFGAELDPLFRGRDLLAVARAYTDALGFRLDPVWTRSDWTEREAKNPHAFCTDIDRSGDVRILANLRDDFVSMGTLLHELGHAAYDLHIPRALPWWLRTAAHISTTEGIALWMERAALDPRWWRAWLGLPSDAVDPLAPAARQMAKAQALLTARWVLVMTHFERAFYADPAREDLDRLWWDLVERFQRVRRPERRRAPDWAAKIHLTSSPVYYHNYLLGQCTAAQLAAAMPPCTRDAPAPCGRFLVDRVFAHGAALHWQELLERATGHRLRPEAFVAEVS